MARKRVTGKAGGVTLDSVDIPITKWGVTINSATVQNTDTGDYDSTSNQTWESSVYGIRSAEVTFEGNFDVTASTGSADMIVAKMLADTPLAVVFKIDTATTFGYGDVIIEKVDVELPIADNVTFTASGRTSGKFTLGAPAGP